MSDPTPLIAFVVVLAFVLGALLGAGCWWFWHHFSVGWIP
jgi:hypothetical protein